MHYPYTIFSFSLPKNEKVQVMSKLFVSYKRADKDKVFPLIQKMESQLDFKFWIDIDGIESDEQFSNVIVNAINECEVFLFMYSKSHWSIDPKKDWTVREITFAEKKGKRIVFIDLDNHELPDWFIFRFPDQQVVKACDSQATDRLVIDIRKWLHLKQPDSSFNNHGQNTRICSMAIDLGLPSGTMWASCNVGASEDLEYGGYFAWGETEEKDNYDWSNYTHCDGTAENCLYLGSDISGTKYDVARMKWGDNWRLPTVKQFQELLDNCFQECLGVNDVHGLMLYSKINGKSIFLPAAGKYKSDHIEGNDIIGNYWSSTPEPMGLQRQLIRRLGRKGPFSAFFFGFHFPIENAYLRYANDLHYGFSVRPVSR